MASPSTATNPHLAPPVSKKLTKPNHVLGHVQVRATVHGALLLGFLTREVNAPLAKIIQMEADDMETEAPNLESYVWEASYQHVLSYLLSSLSKEI
jgi:hypothetical protein